MRNLTLVCRSAGSAGLTEHYFTQSHSWAQSCHPYWKANLQPFLAVSKLFQAIPGYSRTFQAILVEFTLCHAISVYFFLSLAVALRLWSSAFRRLLPLGAKGLLQTHSEVYVCMWVYPKPPMLGLFCSLNIKCRGTHSYKMDDCVKIADTHKVK